VNGSIIEHIPVLAETLIEQINLLPDAVMVDATIGHGGHSFLFGKNLDKRGIIIGFDIDPDALQRARSRLEELSCKKILILSNFSRIGDCLLEKAIERVDFILADLGLCSAQVADEKFGLSFNINMPLDMRIDKRLKHTAADIINRENEKDLADLIFKFGQDRASRRIARFIVHERRKEPITTTGQLAEIVCRALGKTGRKRKSRIHPATRTFQALRIAVNSELDNLQKFLNSAPNLLKEHGKIAVISYHSLEDRAVKNDFKQNAEAGFYRIITKKPIMPSRGEIARNRRARSAKLRIAEKR
jgi:16S rRNA (cytosine1402-N4)-methyltransferase